MTAYLLLIKKTGTVSIVKSETHDIVSVLTSYGPNATLHTLLEVDEDNASQIEKEFIVHMIITLGQCKKNEFSVDDSQILDLRSKLVRIVEHYSSDIGSQYEYQDNPNQLKNYGQEVANHITLDLIHVCSMDMYIGIRSIIWAIYFDPDYPMNRTIRLRNTTLVERFEDGKWIKYTREYAIYDIIMKGMILIDGYLIETNQVNNGKQTCMETFLPESSNPYKCLYHDVELMLEKTCTIRSD